MSTLPNRSLQSQSVYSHNVVDTNESFHFLGISEKTPPVLFRLLCWIVNSNHNIKINSLLINNESWSTFIKLAGFSNMKKTILSKTWRKLAFPCDPGIFFRRFLSFCLPLDLQCVWSFRILSRTVNSVPKSFISVSVLIYLTRWGTTGNMISFSVIVSFLVIIYFSTLYSWTLHNYTITNTFDKLELKNVCENPKTDIKHLCKYKCYARFSKHRKSTFFIF